MIESLVMSRLTTANFHIKVFLKVFFKPLSIIVPYCSILRRKYFFLLITLVMAEEASSVSRIMAQVMTILTSLGIKRSGFDHFPVMVVFFFGLGVGGGVSFFALRVPTVYSPGWRIHGFWRTMIIT